MMTKLPSPFHPTKLWVALTKNFISKIQDDAHTLPPPLQYIAVDGGIRVTWDGNDVVQVEVQNAMQNEVCGICGNFDGDDSNDWTVGDSEQCMEKYPDVAPGDIVSTSTQHDLQGRWLRCIWYM